MYSDRYMQKLWRDAILILYNNHCANCGETYELECHHVIKRRNKQFRHDYRNGILLCKECHIWAETLDGKKWIIENHIYYDDILEEELHYKTFKDYRFYNNITEKEFLDRQAEELKLIIKGEYNENIQ